MVHVPIKCMIKHFPDLQWKVNIAKLIKNTIQQVYKKCKTTIDTYVNTHRLNLVVLMYLQMNTVKAAYIPNFISQKESSKKESSLQSRRLTLNTNTTWTFVSLTSKTLSSVTELNSTESYITLGKQKNQ